MATDLLLYAQFKASKTGKTGLTPTIDVWKVAKADLTITQIVTGGSCTEIGRGLYGYRIAAATPLTHDYLGVIMTSDATVDDQQLPALRFDYGESRATEFAYLDATISSRNATTPPTAAANATAVRSELATELARVDVAVSSVVTAFLDALLAGHTIAGSVAAALAAAGAAGDPMTNPASGYATGSLGELIMHLATYPVIVHRDTTDQYGNVYVTQSCDYYAEDGRALTWTKATWPVLTGATVVLRVNTGTARVDLPCTVTAAQTVQLELSASQVDSLGVGVMAFDLLATLDNGHDVDLYLQQMLTVTSVLAAP